MSYVYDKVDDLNETEKVGSKQCVALVIRYANTPNTGQWTEGKIVLGTPSIPKGTAIATFVGGKYQSNATGNHAAFYISQDAGGIWVMDQWFSDVTKPKVSKRYLRKRGKTLKGAYIDPSNNAEAYSIIE
jgi:hypothetical protein